MGKGAAIGLGIAAALLLVASQVGMDSSIRQRVIDAANNAVGLNASTQAQEFEDFLGGPGEAPSMSQAMALSPASSTCGLTMRAILRNAGFTEPSLFAPYQIGTAISAIVQWAQRVGAWVPGNPSNGVPQAGDLVFGDVDKPSGHVWTLVEADPDTMTFSSVDGGAVDGQGHQEVVSRKRSWTIQGNSIVDTPSTGNQHIITGWVDVDKLWAAQGAQGDLVS